MRILIDLNKPETIEAAKQALEDYKKWIRTCVDTLVSMMMDTGTDNAGRMYGSALYAGNNDTQVGYDVERKGDTVTGRIYAYGTAVLFIEFGTGITKGDNPQERAEASGGNLVPHGWYGRGNGANLNGWFLSSSGSGNMPPDTDVIDGNKVHTFGNDANSCLYLTREDLIRDFESMARTVFSGD